MRKILLTTMGSYGDLHPYLAVARVLKAHGDEVTIVTHQEYQDQVERLGVRFVATKPGLDEIGPQEAWAAKANSSFRGSEFIIRTLVMPYVEDAYRVLKEVSVGQDLIVSHILTFAAPIVAEELNIPWVSSILQPATFFSAYDPPAMGAITILPRMKWLGPRFMTWFMRTMIKTTEFWTEPVQALREKVGLPRWPKNVLVDGFSPRGTLTLFPAAFAPPQPDWPDHVKQVGFPLFDEETTDKISPDLASFLAAGERPVVFTLGTAIVMMETSYFEIAYQAVKRLGLRAVFLVGKRQQRLPTAAISDPQIHISKYEPFSGLFPHAAAIVHQCGVGTTAQALASGRPQVCVPFAHDQPDNARRVVAHGAGVSITARRLSVRRLVKALRTVTQDESYSTRAASLATDLNVKGFDQRLLTAIDQLLAANPVAGKT